MSQRLNKTPRVTLAVAIGALFAIALLTAIHGPIRAAADDAVVDLGHGYARRGDHIYFKGQRIEEAGKHDIDKFAKAVGYPLTLCHDVDAKSFAAPSEEYTKDKNQVYYKWISPGRFWVCVLPDADPKTFEVLGFNLAKDAKHVWRYDQPIEGADPASAEVVHSRWAWKDRHRVYYHGTGKPFPGADPKTFRHLDQAFFRDAKRVYWSDSLLKDADVATFKTFGDEIPYAADKNHVWIGKTILSDVDAAAFELLHNHVYKDAGSVYVGGNATRVPLADAPTFKKVADLGPGNRALFKDATRYFVFDPTYIEVYALEPKDGSVFISKPVWLRPGRLGGKKSPVHAATVSAKLKDGTLSDVDLVMQPGYEDTDPPTHETGKIRQLKSVFIEAQKHMK